MNQALKMNDDDLYISAIIRTKLFQAYAQYKDFFYLFPLLLMFAFILGTPATLLEGNDDLLALQGVDNATRQLVLGMCFIMAFIGMLNRASNADYQLHNQKLMFVLLFFTLVSMTWSPLPFLTLKRWLQFAGILFAGWCALGTANPQQRLLKMMRYLFGVIMLASVVAFLVRPDISIDGATGAWKGLYAHKNTLGLITAIVVSLWLPVISRQNKMEKYAGILVWGLAVFVAWKSQSATAIVSISTITMFYFFVSVPIRWGLKISLAPIPLLLGLLWLYNTQHLGLTDLILNGLGRDASMTGRTELWPYVWKSFQEHLFFGVGYNSFWTGFNVETAAMVEQIGWQATQSHNGYLDILNETGIIGASIFALITLQMFVRMQRLFLVDKGSAMTMFLLLITQLIANLVESSFARGTSPGWIIFLVIYVALAISVPMRPNQKATAHISENGA